MFKTQRVELEVGGKLLILETGRVARQAHGAVLVTYGETVVLVTAVANAEAREGIDFFPLTVNFETKTYAAGRIPGGFFKREGRPPDSDTLTSRLIDRPIRPLFPKWFQCETQIIATVLSHDCENNPDIAGMIGTSAALSISDIPFLGPIAGVRIGFIDGEYVVNPTLAQLAESKLNLIMAGSKDAVMMVESGSHMLSEAQMLKALELGHAEIRKVVALQEQLVELVGKPKRPAVAVVKDADIAEKVAGFFATHGAAAYALTGKKERYQALSDAKKLLVENLSDVEKLRAKE